MTDPYKPQTIELTKAAAIQAIARALIDSGALVRGTVMEISESIAENLGFK